MHTLWSEVIEQLQAYIAGLGFTPLVHFELEGCYQAGPQHAGLNYQKINQQLKALDIDGELIAEYWRQQWEYVSRFAGQSPLKEADNLARVLCCLPVLLHQQGVTNTLIKPVVWAGDRGKLALGGTDIFTNETRAVHIPNAIQLNVSVLDDAGNNLVAEQGFGECLQRCFMTTSLPCCLLYLPEPEAFERFALKTRYGLAAELCSPCDISGGHQGSVALYRERGKHNQKMGEKPLLYGCDQQVLLAQYNWQKTARIEHRLGASSLAYNPYLNVIYALLNLIDALHVYVNDRVGRFAISEETLPSRSAKTGTAVDQSTQRLPSSLYDQDGELGAISLFQQETWFNRSIDAIVTPTHRLLGTNIGLGTQIKQALLARYTMCLA